MVELRRVKVLNMGRVTFSGTHMMLDKGNLISVGIWVSNNIGESYRYIWGIGLMASSISNTLTLATVGEEISNSMTSCKMRFRIRAVFNR